jgi:hypothetical protein
MEEDALFSSRRHFNACGYWMASHYVLGLPTVVVAALAATAIGRSNGVATILAVCAAVLAAVNTFLNPQQRAAAHSSSGNRYNALRNKARRFRELHCTDSAKGGEELDGELSALASELDKLNAESPWTPRWAYRKAKKGIEGGEAAYVADESPEGPVSGTNPG